MSRMPNHAQSSFAGGNLRKENKDRGGDKEKMSKEEEEEEEGGRRKRYSDTHHHDHFTFALFTHKGRAHGESGIRKTIYNY